MMNQDNCAGDSGEFGHWRLAAEAGDVVAMYVLGGLLAARGELDEAQVWYELAAEGGDRDARDALVLLLAERGDLEAAERWYQRVPLAVDPEGMHRLARLCADRDDIDKAERWYRQAAEAGAFGSMLALGELLATQGKGDEAQLWWQQAAAGGEFWQLSNGRLLEQCAGLTQTERWFEQVAQSGDPAAMHRFGVLLVGRGRGDQAESWLRRAAEAGHFRAIHDLRQLLAARGELDEAAPRYRQATLPRPPTRALRLHGKLAPLSARDTLVSVSVGPSGEAMALWSSAANRQAMLLGRISRPVVVRVTVHQPKLTSSIDRAEVRLDFPTIQPLPGGRALVVGRRCRRGPEGPERNAVVFDDTGAVVADGTFGDGIEHVFATHEGDVWVGYFDEGIFGGHDWESHGIVEFTSDLELIWRFPNDGEFDSPADCYALNVTDDVVWACYYTDFPIVRIDAGTVMGWHNKEVADVRALAVAGSTVALAGGYQADHDRAVVGELTADHFTPQRQVRLTMPNGSEIPPDAHLVGRGDEFHVLIGSRWYKIDLDQL